MIRVAINTLPLQSGHKTRGIGFYTRYLLDFLGKRSDVQVVKFNSLSEIKEADIVHYPYFDLFQRTLPLKKRFSTVVTIHDATPLVFPEHYPSGIKGFLNNLYQKISLKTVQAVIIDSESSKVDIAKYLGVPFKKNYSIHLAPAPCFKPLTDQLKLQKVKEKYHLPSKFALFTGSVNWNKNLLNLTAGCLQAGIDLVLAGKDFENEDNLTHPERQGYAEFLRDYSGNSKVHVLGFLPQADLVAVMNLTQVLLLPSYYEGFGLPILEAQACGTPVITANVSSMPEIAGEGAALVNPNDVYKISQTIIEVTSDQKLRERLIQSGFQNVKNFSWTKTAEETVKVYSQVIRKSF